MADAKRDLLKKTFDGVAELYDESVRTIPRSCSRISLNLRSLTRVLPYLRSAAGRVEQQTAQQYIDLLRTFSVHIAMPQDKRRHLEAEVTSRISSRPEGTVRRHWMTILHVARRNQG